MFGNKNKTGKKAEFSKAYCDGFNVGTSLVKNYASDERENIKRLLHLMLQERSKDVVFHGIFAGYSYQVEQVRSLERIAEIKNIENNKTRDNELER